MGKAIASRYKGQPLESVSTESAPVTHAELAQLVAVVERIAGMITAPAPAAAADPLFLSLKEAGARLGLSEGCLRRLARAGGLPVLRDRRLKCTLEDARQAAMEALR